jgi:hypothetical protein
MFGQGEGYDPGLLNRRIGFWLTIVLQPPAFLEKTAWQGGGRNCDCLGRVVHRQTLACAFAEFVQKPRSSSGKFVKSENSRYRAVRSEQELPRTSQTGGTNLALGEKCLEIGQSLVEFNPVFASFRSAYGLAVRKSIS